MHHQLIYIRKTQENASFWISVLSLGFAKKSPYNSLGVFFIFLECWARNSICLCTWSGQVVVDEGARIVDSDSSWRVRWTPLTALERAPALVSQQISRYGQQGVPPSWPEPSLAALPCSLPQGKLIFVNIFPIICLRSSFPTTCGRVSIPFVSVQAE